MYIFHLTVQAKPGRGPDYEQANASSADDIANSPGFRQRMLLRDEKHEGRYYLIAIWDSIEALKAYQNKPETIAAIARADELQAWDIVEMSPCSIANTLSPAGA